MRRALQTCLLSLEALAFSPRILCLPMAMEGAGDGVENQGRVVEEVAKDCELQCFSHWPKVDFGAVGPGKWWERERELNKQGGGRRRQAADLVRFIAQRPEQRIMVYSHWGTVEAMSGRSLSNGGAMLEYVFSEFEGLDKAARKWSWTHVRKRD
mmetsp:Transcript_4819/g.7716  ORF Transcript_4819/g.7716 Transcript_4819/m.7716 type:complete len:154 (-) Transcript_4819:2380-2841(-)